MKPLMTLPCKNKHSDMKKREKGYHCKSCDHVLTDFRKSSEEEIQHTLQSNPGKICGVFNNDQLEYKVSHVHIALFRAVGLSLLGILGFLGPVVTSCDSDTSASEIKQNAFNLLKFPMHVKGTVKDEKTGKVVPYFEVEVLQHGKVIKKVKTDKNGHFDILIQKDDLDQEVFKLAIGGMGYQKDTITSNIKKFNSPQKVRLSIKAEPDVAIEVGKTACTSTNKNNYQPVMQVEGIVREEVWSTGGIPAMEVMELTDVVVKPTASSEGEVMEQRVWVPQEPPIEKEPKKKKERRNRNRQ